MQFHTVIEPFRIKTVEPIRHISREERQAALEKAGYNLFLVKAEDVLIDLLTDSGTGAMSSAQWGGMMQGDESYAGARSFFHFESAVREITGLKHVSPTHQGRAAERILFGSAVKQETLCPTIPTSIPRAPTWNSAMPRRWISRCPRRCNRRSSKPFKGNIDLEALERVLAENPAVCRWR